MKTSDFKVGDKVKLLVDEGGRKKGDEGIVVHIKTAYVGVKYNTSHEHGHTCENHCAKGYGRYHYANNLEIINSNDLLIKVGDKVKCRISGNATTGAKQHGLRSVCEMQQGDTGLVTRIVKESPSNSMYYVEVLLDKNNQHCSRYIFMNHSKCDYLELISQNISEGQAIISTKDLTIGDRVVMIDNSDGISESVDNGVKGTVMSIINDKKLKVLFDTMTKVSTLEMKNGMTIYVHEIQRVTSEVNNLSKSFEMSSDNILIGGRVKCINGYGGQCKGLEGTIFRIRLNRYVVVEFDEEFSEGHDDGGKAKAKHCREFPLKDIKTYLEYIGNNIPIQPLKEGIAIPAIVKPTTKLSPPIVGNVIKMKINCKTIKQEVNGKIQNTSLSF